jgi:hypothetical protein
MFAILNREELVQIVAALARYDSYVVVMPDRTNEFLPEALRNMTLQEMKGRLSEAVTELYHRQPAKGFTISDYDAFHKLGGLWSQIVVVTRSF